MRKRRGSDTPLTNHISVSHFPNQYLVLGIWYLKEEDKEEKKEEEKEEEEKKKEKEEEKEEEEEKEGE